MLALQIRNAASYSCCRRNWSWHMLTQEENNTNVRRVEMQTELRLPLSWIFPTGACDYSCCLQGNFCHLKLLMFVVHVCVHVLLSMGWLLLPLHQLIQNKTCLCEHLSLLAICLFMTRGLCGLALVWFTQHTCAAAVDWIKLQNLPRNPHLSPHLWG